VLYETTAQVQLPNKHFESEHPHEGALSSGRHLHLCLLLWMHTSLSSIWPSDTNKYLCISDHTGPKFDIDMLVSLLRQENARDICVIKVPPEMRYTDYFVIASGTSTRHLHAMAYYVVKMVGCFLFSLDYKLRRAVASRQGLRSNT
jgi:hypothetical protein